MRTYNSLSPDISAIVVNYRSRAYLSLCLSSLREALESTVSCEVIVVNNDKSENLEDTQKKFSFIRFIHSESNIGFGPAGNIGAEHARGKILVFLNPDARVEKDFFLKLLEEFTQNDDVAVAGAGLYDSRGHIQEWSAGYEVNLWDLARNNMGIARGRKIWECKVKKEAHWVSGAAMAIKKDVFDELAGFDERFFMYFEDIDLCRRVRATGKKVYYCPEIAVCHAEGGSRIETTRRKQIYYKSQNYYFEKYYGRWVARVVRILRILFHK